MGVASAMYRSARDSDLNPCAHHYTAHFTAIKATQSWIVNQKDHVVHLLGDHHHVRLPFTRRYSKLRRSLASGSSPQPLGPSPIPALASTCTTYPHIRPSTSSVELRALRTAYIRDVLPKFHATQWLRPHRGVAYTPMDTMRRRSAAPQRSARALIPASKSTSSKLRPAQTRLHNTPLLLTKQQHALALQHHFIATHSIRTARHAARLRVQLRLLHHGAGLRNAARPPTRSCALY